MCRLTRRAAAFSLTITTMTGLGVRAARLLVNPLNIEDYIFLDCGVNFVIKTILYQKQFCMTSKMAIAGSEIVTDS